MKHLSFLLLLALAACGRDASNPQPEYTCLQSEISGSGRSGPYYTCIKYGLACPAPTVLRQETVLQQKSSLYIRIGGDTKDEPPQENRTRLVCRLPE